MVFVACSALFHSEALPFCQAVDRTSDLAVCLWPATRIRWRLVQRVVYYCLLCPCYYLFVPIMFSGHVTCFIAPAFGSAWGTAYRMPRVL